MVASPLSQRMGVTERVDGNVNKNVPNQALKFQLKDIMNIIDTKIQL